MLQKHVQQKCLPDYADAGLKVKLSVFQILTMGYSLVSLATPHSTEKESAQYNTLQCGSVFSHKSTVYILALKIVRCMQNSCERNGHLIVISLQTQLTSTRKATSGPEQFHTSTIHETSTSMQGHGSFKRQMSTKMWMLKGVVRCT